VKLEKAVFKYVEHELYNYQYALQEIEDLREDIIESVPFKETIPGSGHISDPTARKAVKLITNKAIKRMSDTILAIERALDRLNPDHRAIFELKHCQRLPWQKVCEEMPVSERTYFRLRRELVYMVALEMGLLKINLAESWQK